MSARPRLLLLDANAVITAIAAERWDALLRNYQVWIPATVVEESIYAPSQELGRINPIDLSADIANKRIHIYSATVPQLAGTYALFHPLLAERVDAGEAEALTYLRLHNTNGVAFVTSDAGALEATVALDVAACAMSLDTVLQKCGHGVKLSHEHTQPYVKRKLADGQRALLENRALAPAPGAAGRPKRTP